MTMAASDQHYRSPKTLDILFAVSCIVMLLSLILMFVQDYFKDFKSEQRVFRDVETALAERQMGDQLFALMHDESVSGFDAAFQAADDAEKEVERLTAAAKK